MVVGFISDMQLAGFVTLVGDMELTISPNGYVHTNNREDGISDG